MQCLKESKKYIQLCVREVKGRESEGQKEVRESETKRVI